MYFDLMVRIAKFNKIKFKLLRLMYRKYLYYKFKNYHTEFFNNKDAVTDILSLYNFIIVGTRIYTLIFDEFYIAGSKNVVPPSFLEIYTKNDKHYLNMQLCEDRTEFTYRNSNRDQVSSLYRKDIIYGLDVESYVSPTMKTIEEILKYAYTNLLYRALETHLK